MSRRAHVVRTQTQPRGPSQSRSDAGVFTWNASLQEIAGPVTIYPGEFIELAGSPHHETLVGEDLLPGPADSFVKIRIPRDGIYSVSALVSVQAGTAPLGTQVGIDLFGGNQYGFLGYDRTQFIEDPAFEYPPDATLNANCAGYPFLAGDTVWAVGSHSAADAYVQMKLQELSVTYEAVLGTVYPAVGGG